jgi:hypothetical protein
MLSVTTLSKHCEYLKRFSNQINSFSFLDLIKGGEASISLPSTFSLIDNAEESLAAIAKIVKAIRSRKGSIHLDHTNENRIDYAAHALLASSVETINKKEKLLRHKPRQISGRYPQNAAIRRLMNNAGIVNALGFHAVKSQEKDDEKIILFKEKSLDEKNEFGSVDPKTRAAEKLQNHLNECLFHLNLELDEQAERLLGQYAGEILCNCEDHSDDNLWTITAYLDINEHPYYCDIVIFNFGLSYSDTFLNLPPSHFARQQVDSYVTKHSGKSGITDRALYTVAALQELVSSRNESIEGTRGCGTVDFIEFFQQVSSECIGERSTECKMALISGDTHILFTDKYRMARSLLTKKKEIAFNSSNDLELPPDKEVVTNMRAISFPGTIISIRFPLEPATKQERI